MKHVCKKGRIDTSRKEQCRPSGATNVSVNVRPFITGLMDIFMVLAGQYNDSTRVHPQKPNIST